MLEEDPCIKIGPIFWSDDIAYTEQKKLTACPFSCTYKYSPLLQHLHKDFMRFSMAALHFGKIKGLFQNIADKAGYADTVDFALFKEVFKSLLESWNTFIYIRTWTRSKFERNYNLYLYIFVAIWKKYNFSISFRLNGIHLDLPFKN